MEINISWEPQPRQLVLLEACGLSFPFDGGNPQKPVADVFGYGGAAGGGKSDSLLAIASIACFAFPGINIAYFRREFPTLEGLGGAIPRSLELWSHFAKYNSQKHKWSFPTNSYIQFCHCQNENDVYKYQSQQFDILLIDESTQFSEEMIDYLITRNRATVEYPTFKPFAVFATNPGNEGHSCFKERFVSIGKPETVHHYKYPTNISRKHFFIPSRLEDNEILTKRDPGYADRIATSELNRRMLLEGDWDVFVGQAFNELRVDKHMTDPYELTDTYNYFGAYDHGFNHPFSFGIFSVDGDGNVDLVRHIKDRLKRVDEIATMMHGIFDLNKLEYIVAGHDCWIRGRDGGPSVQEKFGNKGIYLSKAKIDRIQGVHQVRAYLAWKETVKRDDGYIDGVPRFRMFSQYTGVYDTLARMIFDPKNPEDVLKTDANDLGKGGDDDYDMVRYGLMSRPPLYEEKKKKVKKGTMQELRQWVEQKEIARRQYYV